MRIDEATMIETTGVVAQVSLCISHGREEKFRRDGSMQAVACRPTKGHNAALRPRLTAVAIFIDAPSTKLQSLLDVITAGFKAC
jgi:hypothetical protein